MTFEEWWDSEGTVRSLHDLCLSAWAHGAEEQLHALWHEGAVIREAQEKRDMEEAIQKGKRKG